MTNIILLSLIFYLVNMIVVSYAIRMAIKHKDKPESVARGDRATRSLWNLKESFPAFLVLGMLSIQLDVEGSAMPAMVWLVARVVYLPIYWLGITSQPIVDGISAPTWLRSLVWTISLLALISMGVLIFCSAAAAI